MALNGGLRRQNRRWCFLALALLVGACGRQDAETYLREAGALQKAGDRAGAIIQLKNAVQREPANREARLALGSAYLAEGDFTTAEKELHRAHDLRAAPDRTVPLLARALLGMGEFKKILEEIHPADGMSPATLAVVNAARGTAQVALGEDKEAEESFQEAERAQAGHPDIGLGRANLALRQGKPDEAMRLVESVLAKDPRHRDAWLMKADLLRITGRSDAAAAAYRTVLSLDARYLPAHLGLASLLLGTGKEADAEQQVQVMARFAPNSVGVVYLKAQLAFHKHDLPKARDHLLHILREAPDHVPARLLAAAVNYGLGDFEQAQADAAKVVEVLPHHAEAIKLLAASQIQRRHPGDALETLQPLGIEGSRDPGILALAGEAALALGDAATAMKYVEAASRADAANPALRTELAMQRLGRGDIGTAMADLKAAANLDPTHFKADALLALIHLNRHEFDRALVAIAALEKKIPGNPMVYHLRGSAHLGMKDAPAARKDFEQALAARPDYFPAAASLAQLDLRENEPGAARRRFEGVLARNPGHVLAMVSLAEISLAQGREAEYRSWLERAAGANPRAYTPRAMLARYWLAKNEPAKALGYATEGASANARNPEALELLGQAQLAGGDLANAAGTFRRLAELVPNSVVAHAHLASVLLRLHNPEGARWELERVLQLEPANVDAKLLLGRLELDNRHFTRASMLARSAQEVPAARAAGLELEGDVIATQGKVADALGFYERAFEASRSWPMAVKLHDAYVAAGSPAKGEERISAWVQAHPEDLAARLYLALDLARRREFPRAIQQYETVLKRSPGNAQALNDLAWIYDQMEDPRARATAEAGYRKHPEDVALLDTYGWILVRKGEVQPGLELIRKAFAQAPRNPEIHWHLAYALHRAGASARSREELKKLLDGKPAFPQEAEARALLQQLGG